MYPKNPENQLPRTRGMQEVLYRLVICAELVEEAIIRDNGALRNGGGTVGVTGMLLEETVPVL